jgi:hypothetical protein
MTVETIVAIGGISVGMLILGLAAWSILSAWQQGDEIQDDGKAVSGWGTPGEKREE